MIFTPTGKCRDDSAMDANRRAEGTLCSGHSSQKYSMFAVAFTGISALSTITESDLSQYMKRQKNTLFHILIYC